MEVKGGELSFCLGNFKMERSPGLEQHRNAWLGKIFLKYDGEKMNDGAKCQDKRLNSNTVCNEEDKIEQAQFEQNRAG